MGAKGSSHESITRRHAVARLALLGAGFVAGCTPLRIALKGYPETFETDERLVDATLRAFVTAVIPGASADEPNLVRAFYDDELSELSRYRGFMVSDLCRRAARRYGIARFAALDEAQRTRVIRDGIAGDPTTRRLYEAAIFLTQVSFYAGIYDDERGCPLIEWNGRYRPRPLSEIGYPNPERYLAAAATRNGNYA